MDGCWVLFHHCYCSLVDILYGRVQGSDVAVRTEAWGLDVGLEGGRKQWDGD